MHPNGALTCHFYTLVDRKLYLWEKVVSMEVNLSAILTFPSMILPMSGLPQLLVK